MLRLRAASVAPLLAFFFAAPSSAADDPPGTAEKAAARPESGAAAVSNWQGFYFGGHVGAFTGTTTISDPDGPGLFGGSVTTPGFLVGVQAGYNWLFLPQWLAGVQIDGSYLTSQGHNTCLQSSIDRVGADCRAYPSELAALTGRLGYVTEPGGRTLIYGKAGVAWMHSQLSVNPGNTSLDGFALADEANAAADPLSQSLGAWGWTVGAGVEYAMTPKWSLDLGYEYVRFSGMNVATPQTIDVTTAGHVTTVSGSSAGVAQDLHIARVGLNYHWGGVSRPSGGTSGDTDDGGTWVAGWEFETGARYWYSSGNFQSANGTPGSLVSRLPFDNMEGHSGELFGRLDSPFNVFLKGFVGGGVITNGTMYDEDWGLASSLAAAPTGYEITQSGVNGSFSYLTADVGYNILRGRDHKVGLFVGYNRYQTLMNTQGCSQLVNPESGVCAPNIPASANAITEFDTWHSLRLGVSAEVQFWDRFKIGVDLAYLPYVYVDALDTHRLRDPPLSFPVNGTGNGVQGELILSYRLTDAFSIGIGGRYWSMWTTTAQLQDGSSFFSLNTDRSGVFVQASYRFGKP